MAMAIGAVKIWTRKPLIPKAMNSAAEPLAARALFASTRRSRSTIDRQVGVVGGVEERRQDRREPGHDQQLREGQDPEREGDGHGPEQDRPPEIGPDEHRPPAQPIHPRAGHEPEDERRAELQRAQERDLDRPGAQHEDRRQRQGDPRDERPEDRDRRGGPDADERPGCARGWSRRDCARRAEHTRAVRRPRRPGPSSGPRFETTLRYTPPARCVRTRAPARLGSPPVRTTTTLRSPDPDHVRHPQRAASQDARQPDRQGPDQRGRRRCRHARRASRAARGGRQLQGRQGLRRPRPRAGHRPRGPREPVGRPAGRQDRQRRAGRAPVGRRPDLPPVGQPRGRRDGRPAGLGQDDLDRQARPPRRQARPPSAARRGRPVPPGRRRPARDARQEPRHPRLPRARRDPGRRHRPRRRRGRQAPGPRRRHPRHRRPPLASTRR